MSLRRSTRDQRCPGCRINRRWCFCDHLLPLKSKIFLTVVMHKKELALTSNTSSLALKMLAQSELLVRGYRDEEFKFVPQENRQPLYLFPSEDAQVLTKEYAQSFGRPIQLVLPDGTWRQAKKFHKREPSLAAVPRVKVEGNLERIYTLRKNHLENGVCSLEAIALALGILDGPAVRDGLLEALNVMNQRIEISRNPSLWHTF